MKGHTMTTLVALLLIAANLWQFIAVPLLPPAWAWTLLPLALTSNTLWSAIHEGIHGHIPRWLSRTLACLFGSSFTFLSAAHLTHHQLNRTEAERLEVIAPGESLWRARLRYYFFLSGGLYLLEMFAPLGFILSLAALRRIAANSDEFTRRFMVRCIERHVRIAIESLASMAFLALSAFLYSDRWPLLVAILAARAFLISSLDYIYHYGAALDRDLGVFNLWLPRPFSVFLLNFNLHRQHHQSTLTPWTELPSSCVWYDDRFIAAALRVWRGPKQ